MTSPQLIRIESCPKAYSKDLDKAFNPLETIRIAEEKLRECGPDILKETHRIDTGRLGIPVYISLCGPLARSIMPTRKQMGKGSSPGQAKASAIMEFIERFSFFSFWQAPTQAVRTTWKKAEQLFGDKLIPVKQILNSVHDNLPEATAREILDLAEWLFYPATNLGTGEITWVPLDWFRLLSEFNGSSSGNTNAESLLQGLSELIERHASAVVDEQRPTLATLDPSTASDPVLTQLIEAFAANDINLILKDISQGMPLPTVAALAWDESTFPEKSEIIFTAGTATSPEKAAIRAITEVAQLGGDFCTGSCYEASGLPKFSSLAEIQWLLDGPLVSFSDLPNLNQPDIRDELRATIHGMAPMQIYAVETTHPGLGIPAHYCIAPGLEFRERDKNSSLGLFTGRKLVEEANPESAKKGLAAISSYYPDNHFTSFFEAQLALQAGQYDEAARLFAKALPLQPDSDSRSLAAFYAGYALSQKQDWHGACRWLEMAHKENPALKEAANLLGVAHFKLKNYPEAEICFNAALNQDKGSAMDLANRGVVRKLMGRREEAIQDLAKALELQPDLDFAASHLQELLNDA